MRKKKEELIPPHKSKNVIYLDRRGREKPNYLPSIITGICSLLCILYCLAIFFFIGYGTKFFLIWGVIGVALAGIAYLLYRKDLCEMIPEKVKMIVFFLVGIGAFMFVFTEFMIIKDFTIKRAPDADYVIVLGAQWKTTGPSWVLKYRLDTALDYLKAHPNAQVIVSGGQGANEIITEAQGMAEYLQSHGIEEERIYKEEASVNTNQNLLYSSFLLDKESDSVVIVTNNFHVFRAVGIAKKLGYKKVDGLSAPSVNVMLPNNLLREFIGVWKDTIFGNMKFFH